MVVDTVQITESSSKITRNQFEQILNFIKKSKEPHALIIDTVDRLQRSFRETPILDELRRQGKLELHFLREGLIINQHSNSAQLLQWDIGVLFASSYVRQLSDNVKRSQEQCVKNGQWTSKAPYGYKNVCLPSGAKTIEIDPVQAPFVVLIFELYACGNNSFQTVATALKAKGFPRTDRGKSITARTVEVILNNPFYMGVMRVKGQSYTHKYDTLISEALFNTAQQVMASHNKSPVHHAGKPILFRGLLYCKRCGCAASGDIKKGKYVYYSCHNSKRICAKKWVKEEDILSGVFDVFDALHLTDTQIDEIVDYIEEGEAQAAMVAKQNVRALNDKLMLARERVSKLVDMHVDGKIDAETYHLKLEEYKREQQSLTTEIKSYDQDSTAELIAAKDVLELTQEAREIFESSKFNEKQQLLGFFISNLTLDDGKLDVELHEPFKTMAISQDQTIWRS